MGDIHISNDYRVWFEPNLDNLQSILGQANDDDDDDGFGNFIKAAAVIGGVAAIFG